MKLQSANQILDERVRAKILDDICAADNQRRKAEMFKRYECLKDMTEKYVIRLLMAQFDASTVNEMQYAITNVSIMRKIVDKIARVYGSGVKRTCDKKRDTSAVEEMSEQLKINEVMKRLDRYLVAFRNTMAYVHPLKQEEAGAAKYRITVDALPPFLYDVIESPDDPEKPMVVILSNYKAGDGELYTLGNAATAGRGPSPIRTAVTTGSAQDDDALADSVATRDGEQYIWWTKDYHFTTDKKGVITKKGDGNDGVANPIGTLPFVNFAREQDGAFWALGGNDLADGAIKINALLTNINHVSISQGYGQLYMTGENLPKSVKVGPNHCIQLEHTEGQPQPQVGFLSANPPMGEMQQLIEMYVALLLSTNNLSTTGFSSSLKDARQLASGVAMLIDRSELIEDIGDRGQVFRDGEPQIWKVLSRWANTYREKALLIDDMQEVPLPMDVEVNLTFGSPQPILSELDKLAILEKRKELGLSTQVELLMRDDPGLTEDEAKAKLDQITKEKMDAMDAFTGGKDEGDGQPGDSEQNGVGDRPGAGGKSGDQGTDQARRRGLPGRKGAANGGRGEKPSEG